MYVERDINRIFELAFSANTAVAVVGPRQAGKTTFLEEKIKGRKGAYLKFDDPDVLGLFDSDIKKFENQFIEGYDLAVLDEVQYGKDSGRKLKYLVDKGRKIWLTSSSQAMLSKEVLSWLVGRVSIIRLYPFSLFEFMRAKNQKEYTPEILKRIVWEHIVYGGYPKATLAEGSEIKTIILKDLYETMVLKDMAKVFSIEDINSLETFCRYLSHSIGNILVYDKAASDMKLSFKTIKKYLDAMEKSYLLAKVEPFHSNKLNEITKQPKVYFFDTGLRNSIIRHFPLTLENEGKLFENYVYCELVKLDLTVKYWQMKSGLEVDFIAGKGEEIMPIEVKLTADPTKVERGLRAFISAYKPKIAFVIFYDGTPGEMVVDGCKVIFTDIMGMIKLLGEKK